MMRTLPVAFEEHLNFVKTTIAHTQDREPSLHASIVCQEHAKVDGCKRKRPQTRLARLFRVSSELP